MTAVLFTIIYILNLIALLFFSKLQYESANKSGVLALGRRKFKNWHVALITLSFVLLNYYATNSNPGFYGHDRQNYYKDFYGRETDWAGLNFLMEVVRGYTSNFNIFLYFTTSICCAIPLFTYRYTEDAGPCTLLFLFSTNFVQYTYVGLKQAYVNAIATVFFCLLLRPYSLKRDIACLLLAVLSCYFQVTGFLLVPLFVCLKILENSPKHMKLYLVVLSLTLLFFEPLALFSARLVEDQIPHLALKIYNYFGENAYDIDENSLYVVFLKGIPFYCLLIWGLVARKRLTHVINNYDKCLFLTAFGALAFLYSISSYWFNRVTAIVYFPMGILLYQLAKYSIPNNRYILVTVTIGGELFLTLRSFILYFTRLGGL